MAAKKYAMKNLASCTGYGHYHDYENSNARLKTYCLQDQSIMARVKVQYLTLILCR